MVIHQIKSLLLAYLSAFAHILIAQSGSDNHGFLKNCDPGVIAHNEIDFISDTQQPILEELWRRIVFFIAVKNTDDHLRNHGFLLTPEGWTLSPAYDVNPVYFGTGLTLNISETDNSLDWDLARSVAKYFRINDKQATEIITMTRTTVSQWPKIASKYKIKRAEQELMAQAFEYSFPKS